MQEYENFDDIAESEPQEVDGPPKTLGELFSNAVDQLVTMVDKRAKFPSDFFQTSEQPRQTLDEEVSVELGMNDSQYFEYQYDQIFNPKMSAKTVKKEPQRPTRQSLDRFLPNVAMLVSDCVKLVRNNSVPMLQV